MKGSLNSSKYVEEEEKVNGKEVKEDDGIEVIDLEHEGLDVKNTQKDAIVKTMED